MRVSPEWLAALDRVRGIASRAAFVKWCVEAQVEKELVRRGERREDPRVAR